MDIKNKTILVLGGTGLVGMAVCRKFLVQEPGMMVVLALTKDEVSEGAELLKKEYPNITIIAEWGNIFVRTSLKDKRRSELLSEPENRKILMSDVLDDLNDEKLGESFLYYLIETYMPDIIIDCVNTATGIAYQDIFLSGVKTLKNLEKAKESMKLTDELIVDVENLICTQLVPQLIRHIQILYESTRRYKTKCYLKIGTSGTGGMGFNIPYTHSEERPSRVLLSKSSMGGAHSLLLFVMARTPDAPIIKEIKPTAAIAWKKIEYGPIYRQGKPIELYDCEFDKTITLEKTLDLDTAGPWMKKSGEFLEAPYIDTGENGLFSRNEFQTITAIGQMAFVTPEEIAANVLYEIRGGSTGCDIINALDNSCMGPTYRAGSMRHRAIKKLSELEKKHGTDSVAFELLGPPRLSKLLYEAYLIKKAGVSLQNSETVSEDKIIDAIETLLRSDSKLRSYILSIGIPILMPDGKRLLRGSSIKIPPIRGDAQFSISDKNIDKWAYDGWVDLRPQNISRWKERLKNIMSGIRNINPDDTSSQHQWNSDYWLEEKELEIGKVVGWIFVNEDKGLRMKS